MRHDVSNTHNIVSDTHIIVSDIHRVMVKNQEASDGVNLPVGNYHPSFVTEITNKLIIPCHCLESDEVRDFDH